MTRLYGDPAEFRSDVIEGFDRAYARFVDRVPNASGFVRRGGTPEGQVGLVVGGGSGHYPSYCGIVGEGLASGCVLGDVFTSPSREQVVRIGRAADAGAGLVFSFGNYAGDRLNFSAAREQLTASGIDTRIVYVTDDVASAPADCPDDRRGIAGTFIVYKIGGAAAATGADLDDVERVMRAANAQTFSFGVAFAGCTLPGHDEPLFETAAGHMDLGLGIHGEPGIRSAAWMPVAELGATLVDTIIAERPSLAGPRAAVVLNGLGATKYEELFVLYGHVHDQLVRAGVDVVEPEVGELVTSLDMAGCSLSVAWLDEELEQLWRAPADTAAFRRRRPRRASPEPPAAFESSVDASPPLASDEASTDDASTDAASEHSVELSAAARRVLGAICAVLVENERRLGDLDAVAGDGDHGSGMVRGIKAAVTAAETTQRGAGSVLQAAGRAFADVAGGTSGLLWGEFLVAIGRVMGDGPAPSAEQTVEAVKAGASAIERVGGAQLGDKTMLDALLPFVSELGDSVRRGEPLAVAWAAGVGVAETAADATAALTPRRGRARPLAARSIGTPDPGAVSMALALRAVGAVLGSAPPAEPKGHP